MGEKLCQVRDGEGDSTNTLRIPKQVIFDKTFSISSQKHFLSSSCRIGQSRATPFKFAVLLVVSCNRRPPSPCMRGEGPPPLAGPCVAGGGTYSEAGAALLFVRFKHRLLRPFFFSVRSVGRGGGEGIFALRLADTLHEIRWKETRKKGKEQEERGAQYPSIHPSLQLHRRRRSALRKKERKKERGFLTLISPFFSFARVVYEASQFPSLSHTHTECGDSLSKKS